MKEEPKKEVSKREVKKASSESELSDLMREHLKFLQMQKEETKKEKKEKKKEKKEKPLLKNYASKIKGSKKKKVWNADEIVKGLCILFMV